MNKLLLIGWLVIIGSGVFGGGGFATGFTATGPASGTVDVASTNFTVTSSGGNFTGLQTITISDGSQGGTLTPSVGSPGTSTITVTPTSGASSFTFTYTPIVVATITLTFTNGQSWTNPGPLTYASAANCTASGNLIARMDGSENQVAVDALICGMVTDGTYSGFDGLHVFATNSTTNALLNWAQNAFNLTAEGSLTFTANAGYTGDGSTGYFKTGFIPSSAGGHYTLNAASLGSCTLTSRTTNNIYVTIGVSDVNELFIEPLTTSNVTAFQLNAASTNTQANTNAQGTQYAVRTSSSNINLYLNNGSALPNTKSSIGLPVAQIYIMGFNNSGSPVNFDGDQVAYVFYGGSFSSTQVGNIYSRLHTYLQAVGETTAC